MENDSLQGRVLTAAERKLDKRTGEFASPAVERAFKRYHWPLVKAQHRLVSAFTAVAYGFAIVIDSYSIGHTPAFATMCAARIIVALLLAAVFVRSLKDEETPQLNWLIVAAELAFCAAELTNHVIYIEHGILYNLGGTPFIGVGILLFYILLPARQDWSLYTSIAGALPYVIYHFAEPRVQMSVAVNTTITIGVAIALGYPLLTRSALTSRRGFLHRYDLEALTRAEQAAQAARIEADRANHSKSRFLAIMSHEMRTPLTGIVGGAEVMKTHSDLPPKFKQPLEIVLRCSRQLCGLIDDVLDLARVEEGKLELKPVDFELPSLLVDVVTVLEFMAKEKRLSLILGLDTELPTHVHADPVRLRQVLFNLGVNAIKFTDKGSIHMRAKLLALEPTRAHVSFACKDTGMGLSQEAQQKVFNAFYQVDESMNRRQGGVGLGLAVCKNLIEAMGGCLSVESAPGEGSSFHFSVWLPLAQESSSEDQLVAATVPLDILLVEDTDTSRYIIADILGQLGHKVVTAGGGRESVQLASQNRFDVILMDLHMPDIDGLEATHMIRALPKPEHANVPILALTADTLPEKMESCLEAGMQGFLAKPLQLATLVASLNQYAQKQVDTHVS